MNAPFISDTLATMMALEAARDAAQFVSNQPIENVKVDLLIDAAIACYKSAGLQLEEAETLYRESCERISDRIKQVAKEMDGA